MAWVHPVVSFPQNVFFKIQYIDNITRSTLKIGTEDRRDYGHDEALCNYSPALQEDGRRPTVWHDSSE